MFFVLIYGAYSYYEEELVDEFLDKATIFMDSNKEVEEINFLFFGILISTSMHVFRDKDGFLLAKTKDFVTPDLIF